VRLWFSDPASFLRVPVGSAEAFFVAKDTISFIQAGKPAVELVHRLMNRRPDEAVHQLDAVKLAPPLRPTTILCSGSNYREHNEEKANAPVSGKEPEFFIKTSDCVVGPGEAIQYDPKLTNKLDTEVELAIVIGRPGRHISTDRALNHVFGYTIVNDVTARDRQVRRSNGVTWYELGRGKAFDTSAPIIKVQTDPTMTYPWHPDRPPPSTLVGVTRLSHPDFLIEIDLMAVTSG
jgi:2-keto-4-pentenoate hydratase/2-oxohepta-3-ene-1,7-dioic acid hydratase in catechol pathway